MDCNDGYVLSIPVPTLLRHGGSDSNLDYSTDFQQKIVKVKEQLRVEQMEQDHNVAEFLKLVNMADKQQATRIRQAFEKKNQKSIHNINQLQKKLEQYYRRKKESESNNNANNNGYGGSKNSSPRDTAKDQTKDAYKNISKEISKDTSKDISKKMSKDASKDACKDSPKDASKDVSKDASKDFYKIMSKDSSKETSKNASKDTSKDTSRDVFKDTSKDASKDVYKNISKDTSKEPLKDVSSCGRHHCLDKFKPSAPSGLLSPPSFFNKPREFANLIRNRFGSADNISQLRTSLDEGDGARVLSGSANVVGRSKFYSDDDDDDDDGKGSTGTSASNSNGNPSFCKDEQNTFTMLMEELQEIRESQIRMAEELEELKENLGGDDLLTQRLEEERHRLERLEEQVNDLLELHQSEMLRLKQTFSRIEEKMAYQSNERARDLQEVLESCNSRLCKLEQQVQVVQVETEGVFSRELLAKVINVLLAIVTLLLVCVSTATRCITPAVRSHKHLLMTVFSGVMIAVIWRNTKLFTKNSELT